MLLTRFTMRQWQIPSFLSATMVFYVLFQDVEIADMPIVVCNKFKFVELATYK